MRGLLSWRAYWPRAVRLDRPERTGGTFPATADAPGARTRGPHAPAVPNPRSVPPVRCYAAGARWLPPEDPLVMEADMRRIFPVIAILVTLLGILAPAAHAAVNVERQGSENAIIEVAKTTVWGALGGLVIGGAIALANGNNDSNGDIVRWSIVGGTFLGLGYGIYHVSHRPPVTALIEFQGGAPTLHATLPEAAPSRGL